MDYRRCADEGAVALDRFRRSGDRLALDQAVGSLREAVSAAPESDPGRRDLLALLGEALGRRYQLSGQTGDLDGAIHACRTAAVLSSRADPGWNSLMFSIAEGRDF